MVVFGQNGCVRAKMVVFGKVVAILESGSLLANMVVLGQKWFSSGKVVVFGLK